MEFLSRIFDWLSDHEAAISAVAAIFAIAVILFTGLRLLLRRQSSPTPEPSADTSSEEDPLLALPTGPVVAVLPFENLSRDPDQEYFSDGLTDDIITALSRFKDLFVIARNSTFRYKGQAVDVRQLNKELGARYVLEGSVQRAESRLRVTAQLLDARDGTHLWAETYDRELSAASIFAVQDEITEQVVATIAGVHGVISRARFAEVTEKPTDNFIAYEAVLQVGAYYRANQNAPEHARVRDSLERAVKSDPRYADAWAFLCFTYLDEYRFNYNPRSRPLDRALDAAQRAIVCDATNQWAHVALAQVHFYRNELDAFLAEAERAVSLNPSNSFALFELGVNLELADDKRGIAWVRKAMKLDPFHPTTYHFAEVQSHFRMGEHEAALAAARKVNVPGFFWTPIYLTALYAELGRESDARTALGELLRLYPGFSIETYIEEARKWNTSEDRIRLWVAALRKAGLPEGTEA